MKTFLSMLGWFGACFLFVCLFTCHFFSLFGLVLL